MSRWKQFDVNVLLMLLNLKTMLDRHFLFNRLPFSYNLLMQKEIFCTVIDTTLTVLKSGLRVEDILINLIYIRHNTFN